MLEAYMRSANGSQRINAQIANNSSYIRKRKDNIDEAVRVLKECISNFAPPSLAASQVATIQRMIDGTVSDSVQTENVWEITVNFNQESLRRPSLNPNSDGVYDIIGLFSQGWDIDEDKKVPFGTWHGRETSALRSRPSRPFVEDAVNFFMAIYANKYGITGIDINPLYGEWGI